MANKIGNYTYGMMDVFPEGWKIRSDEHSNGFQFLNAVTGAPAHVYDDLINYHLYLRSPDRFSYEEIYKYFSTQHSDIDLLYDYTTITGIIGSNEIAISPVDTHYDFLSHQPDRMTYIDTEYKAYVVGSNDIIGLCYTHSHDAPSMYYTMCVRASDNSIDTYAYDIAIENMATYNILYKYSYKMCASNEVFSFKNTLQAQLYHSNIIESTIKVYDILNKELGEIQGNAIIVPNNEYYYDGDLNSIMFYDYSKTIPRNSYQPASNVLDGNGNLLYIIYPSNYQPDWEFQSRYLISYDYLIHGPAAHITAKSSYINGCNTLGTLIAPYFSYDYIQVSDEWTEIPYTIAPAGILYMLPEDIRPNRTAICDIHYVHLEILSWATVANYTYTVPDISMREIGEVKVYIAGYDYNKADEFTITITGDIVTINDLVEYSGIDKFVYISWRSLASYSVLTSSLEYKDMYKSYFNLRLQPTNNKKDAYLHPYTVINLNNVSNINDWMVSKLSGLNKENITIKVKRRLIPIAVTTDQQTSGYDTALYVLDVYNSTLYKHTSAGSYISRHNATWVTPSNEMLFPKDNYLGTLRATSLFQYNLGYSIEHQGFGFYYKSQIFDTTKILISMVYYFNMLYILYSQYGSFYLAQIDVFDNYIVSKSIPIDHLDSPQDMTIDDEGYLLIADGNTLKKFEFNSDCCVVDIDQLTIRYREQYDYVDIS
jgi:hypothetical protein